MLAYYNENDKNAAAWLRELIKRGLITDGIVDERSIVDVRPDDLRGYTRCHFFAGIGGWDYALSLAEWPTDRPVWTGSCPCQPFSAAGKRLGVADSRHLWPEFRRLITECCPAIVFGEQVASKDGREWLAGVRTDLEALGYGIGAADLCAASAGTPHIRQRLYWMADASEQRRQQVSQSSSCNEGTHGRQSNSDHVLASSGAVEWVADADGGRQGDRDVQRSRKHGQQPQDSSIVRLEHSDEQGSQRRCEHAREHTSQRTSWAASELLSCTDGKARRIEPGSFPLAHGVPARVGRLRGYGNAIVPQVAAEFIRACID